MSKSFAVALILAVDVSIVPLEVTSRVTVFSFIWFSPLDTTVVFSQAWKIHFIKFIIDMTYCQIDLCQAFETPVAGFGHLVDAFLSILIASFIRSANQQNKRTFFRLKLVQNLLQRVLDAAISKIGIALSASVNGFLIFVRDVNWRRWCSQRRREQQTN